VFSDHQNAENEHKLRLNKTIENFCIL